MKSSPLCTIGPSVEARSRYMAPPKMAMAPSAIRTMCQARRRRLGGAPRLRFMSVILVLPRVKHARSGGRPQRVRSGSKADRGNPPPRHQLNRPRYDLWRNAHGRAALLEGTDQAGPGLDPGGNLFGDPLGRDRGVQPDPRALGQAHQI